MTVFYSESDFTFTFLGDIFVIINTLLAVQGDGFSAPGNDYLALLGWGDGTENEFFSLDELGESSFLVKSYAHDVSFSSMY